MAARPKREANGLDRREGAGAGCVGVLAAVRDVVRTPGRGGSGGLEGDAIVEGRGGRGRAGFCEGEINVGYGGKGVDEDFGKACDDIGDGEMGVGVSEFWGVNVGRGGRDARAEVRVVGFKIAWNDFDDG